MRNRFRRDPIGFDPTTNQSEWGVRQSVPYSVELRATSPQASVDYFPTWPYRGVMDYTGNQSFGGLITESIFATTHGYRGIAPLDLQPLINRPLPYED